MFKRKGTQHMTSQNKKRRNPGQISANRRKRQRLRRRKVMIMKAILLLILIILLIVVSTAAVKVFSGKDHKKADNTSNTAPQTESSTEQATEDPAAALTAKIEAANRLAMSYDYDGALDLLKSDPSYESNLELLDAIRDIESQKAACVPVDVNTVPHIFYHSLVNEPGLAFSAQTMGTQGAADGMNAWMTTVDEFDKITQKLYENGYVYVRLRDLVVESRDENGVVTFSPNQNLLLPPEKKAIVLSVDDLSYYHSYAPASYPEKLVLDENGKVKCQYITPDGTEKIGDFDVVPRLNTFLEEHPDGAYKGARGLIALTGYNGVLGYRTDIDYQVKANLMTDQSQWLEEHPDFDYDAEIAEATKIATAVKESGWEFASHTWGHLSVTNKTTEELKADNEKWIQTVQNIVGPVDTIIFAHGNDIGDWKDYSSDNQKFQYFKSAGYNFFCNVDGSVPYWVQIRSNYVRQGRINLDGYMLYQASQGQTSTLDHLFKASEVFDPRRPTPVVANGQG
jgi:hypothetical protein